MNVDMSELLRGALPITALKAKKIRRRFEKCDIILLHDPRTGEVLAMCGKRLWHDLQAGRAQEFDEIDLMVFLIDQRRPDIESLLWAARVFRGKHDIRFCE